jgi:hypothetical protein
MMTIMKMLQPKNINSLDAYLKFLVREQRDVDCRVARFKISSFEFLEHSKIKIVRE